MTSVTESLQQSKFNGRNGYIASLQDVNGFVSFWDISEAEELDYPTPFKTRNARMVYEFVRPDATTQEINADLQDGGKRSMAQVSSFIVGDDWMAMWHAAESCIRQSGTHHTYIEDFILHDDNSWMLITGS